MFSPQQYTQTLIDAFTELADGQKAKAMSAYMKNHFLFFGITTTERRMLFKAFLKTSDKINWQQAKEVALYLWKMPYRELHYCAIELIIYYKKQMDEDFIITIENNFILQNSWWDSVDTVNSKLISVYFAKYPKQITSLTKRWNESNNIWLQRSSIIFQLKNKEKTNVSLLSKHIINCSKSKEFFVQKAIGWALREYAKNNPLWVANFVENNELPSLSKREALKHF